MPIMSNMPLRIDGKRRDLDDRPIRRPLFWAELSILEAREMTAEALRIVAHSKAVCQRAKDVYTSD